MTTFLFKHGGIYSDEQEGHFNPLVRCY